MQNPDDRLRALRRDLDAFLARRRKRRLGVFSTDEDSTISPQVRHEWELTCRRGYKGSLRDFARSQAQTDAETRAQRAGRAAADALGKPREFTLGEA